MRPLRALVIYIVVVFLGGALLAPWLYWLAQAGANTFPNLADAPFHRFVNRSLQLLALAGLWPLLRGLGARSAGDLGLVKPAGQWRKLICGLALGLVSLAAIAVFALAGGGRVFRENLTASRIAEKLFSGVLTAVAVSLIEEILFRGGIFGGLRRVLNWRGALVISSAIFAIVHFFARTTDPTTIAWSSGLGQLALMLRGFADWHALIPKFFNLTMIGVLLAIAYQRTGNLYFSIGLHAGWIVSLKCYRELTRQGPNSNEWLWGSGQMVDGWFALVVLSVMLACFTRWRPVEPTAPTA